MSPAKTDASSDATIKNQDVILMAYATQITIGTGRKVSVNYQSKEVQVGVTYQLEREDQNLLQLVEVKAAEIESVHRRLWKKLNAENQQQEQTSTHSNGNGNGALPQDENDAYQTNGNGHNGYSQNGHSSENGSRSNGAAMTEAQERAIYALTRKIQMDAEEVERTLRMRFEKTHIQQLSKREASQFIDELQRKQRLQAGHH
jgi:hypothetical protein